MNKIEFLANLGGGGILIVAKGEKMDVKTSASASTGTKKRKRYSNRKSKDTT
jgi:hypothetical protein